MPDYRHKITVKKSTVAQTVTYDVSWIIPKFKELLSTKTMAGGIRLLSSSVVKVPHSELQLKITFYGSKSQNMEIFYRTTSSVVLKMSLHLKMSCISNNFTEDFHTIEANEWQCCTKSIDTINLTYTFKDEELCLFFIFYISKSSQYVFDNKVDELCDDFKKLLTDDSYSDFTIKSAEGVEFRVHKNVLAIRSKVLKAQFEHNTKESITNLVETQWETEVLRDVLTFVYTNKAPQISEHPEQLLGAADYYQLDGLKSLCEEVLIKRLTVENAIDTIQLAELFSV
ncbi:Roadkill [Operophtera brumata]|uniref:Roadkill n=1 Tax=Operophtera brumata TaxID=104452 RepID=A0A0L7LE50_OPEBR|nr:Roadkill [Operophtera brumata]